nr:unnamed protein product [Digitaria exilis]
MKQRIVIEVQMTGDKSRSKALGLIASTQGVQSVAIEGRERNHLVVVGDGLDAVGLTSYLRKKVGGAQIVQVEVVGDVAAGPQQQWQPRYGSYYYSPAVRRAPYCYDDHQSSHSHPDVDSSCAIM